MKNSMQIIAKLLVAAILFWLIGQFVDLGEAATLIFAADTTWLVAAAMLMVPFALIESVRWTVVMRAMGQAFPFRASLIYTLVGWFFNNVSPANTGQDIFRAVQMTRLGMDKGLAIKSVIIFRLASFWSLLLLVVATLPFALSFAASGRNQITLLVIVVSGCTLLGFAVCLDFVRQILPAVFARDLPIKLLSLLKPLRSVLFRSRQSVQIGAIGIVVHLLRVLIIFVLALSLGIQTSYGELVLFVPIALLVAMIPITLSDWGTREAAFAFFLPWIAISAEQAVGVSVLFGIYRIFNGLPGAIVWLALEKEAYSVTHQR